jgi:hypothetical protein
MQGLGDGQPQNILLLPLPSSLLQNPGCLLPLVWALRSDKEQKKVREQHTNVPFLRISLDESQTESGLCGRSIFPLHKYLKGHFYIT